MQSMRRVGLPADKARMLSSHLFQVERDEDDRQDTAARGLAERSNLADDPWVVYKNRL